MITSNFEVTLATLSMYYISALACLEKVFDFCLIRVQSRMWTTFEVLLAGSCIVH